MGSEMCIRDRVECRFNYLLREERKFESLDALKKQIESDVKEARLHFLK